MFTHEPSTLTTYLALVFGLAAISVVATLGILAEAVVRNRRIRVSRHESLRAYYCRLALHH
jgi:hypothetical protein